MRLGPGQPLAQGRWTIVAPLAESDVAELYDARSAADGRPYLLELVTAPPAADEAFWNECVREAGLAGASSGLFAKLVDVGTEPGLGRILVREAVPSTSLGAALGGGPLPLAQVLALLDGLAPGLDAAHAAGVVHRGLLPTNVFVAAPGAPVKIAELGLARIRAALPRPWPGPVGWAPPEQVRGEATTGAADIYVLAALAHVALTGRHCFASMRPGAAPDPQAVWAEMTGALRIDTGLGAHVDGTLAAALSPQPGQRPPTVAALVQGLRGGAAPAVEAGKRPMAGTLVLGAERPDFAALAASSGAPPRIVPPPDMAPPGMGTFEPGLAPGPAHAQPAESAAPPKKKSSLGLIIGVLLVFMLLGAAGAAVGVSLYLRARYQTQAAAAEAARVKAEAEARQAEAEASAAAAQASAAAATPSAAPPVAAASAAAPTTATITFECDPACESIACDGKPIASLDAGVPLEAGEHECILARAGYAPLNQKVAVEAGKDTAVKVKLEKAPDPAPTAVATPTPKPTPTAKPTTTAKPTGTTPKPTGTKPTGKCGTFINPCKK